MKESVASRIKAILRLSKDVAFDIHPPLTATGSEVERILSSTAASDGQQIDNQTWKDLDLAVFSERVSQGLSITGQIFLQLRMRSGGTADDIARFRSILSCGDDFPTLLLMYAKMRAAKVNICEPLFVSGFLTAPSLGRWTWIPIPLLFASLLLAKFSPVGWLGILCSLVFAGFIALRLFLPMKEWHQQRDVLLSAIATAREMRKTLPAEVLSRTGLPTVQELDAVQQVFRPTIWGRSESVAEYANILFLTQYTEMHRQLKAIPTQTQSLRRLVKSISDFEADLGILVHAQTSGLTISMAQTSGSDLVAFRGLRSPLLPTGAPVSVAIDKLGMLLTGKNGVGKSTLLRAIAVSVVLNRAFGAAYAEEAKISCGFVMSSMRIDDSLAVGDSSHVAEAKRIRDMILHGAAAEGCLFIIDEVFNATNHIESVAAAVPALGRLASQGILLVSTHNLILAPLLRNSLRAVKLELTPAGERLVLDGVIGETNGIDVLEAVGFDDVLVSQSRNLSLKLEEMMSNPGSAHLLKVRSLNGSQLMPPQIECGPAAVVGAFTPPPDDA